MAHRERRAKLAASRRTDAPWREDLPMTTWPIPKLCRDGGFGLGKIVEFVRGGRTEGVSAGGPGAVAARWNQGGSPSHDEVGKRAPA